MSKEIQSINDIDCSNNFPIIVKTFYGLEEVLQNEIENLGVAKVEKINRAVKCWGNIETVYKLNYFLRTALRVLIPLKSFTVYNDKQLYKKVVEIDWSKIFPVNQTFAIENNVYSKYFKHSQYAGLKTKDAIVDRFRKQFNKRPSVDVENPDIRIDLHINNEKVTLSLDSSGDSLHKRGYRLDKTKAPLNEVLAAGLIHIIKWNKETVIYDPMCGSGTIPIEAAMIANNIYPGSLKSSYGFQKWTNYNTEIWNKIVETTHKSSGDNVKIFASDIDPKAILIAKRNAKRAGVQEFIDFKMKDFARTKKPVDDCILITNPPYGQRLQKEDLIQFYRSIGDTLKNKYTGCDAWIFSGSKEALKFIGLRPSEKYNLYNGPIESKFYKYSLYEGSKKNT